MYISPDPDVNHVLLEDEVVNTMDGYSCASELEQEFSTN